VREGKHGARSPQQAIAIGLSKARRAGVKLPPPKKGRTSQKTQRQAARDLRKGRGNTRATSAKRSRATSSALRREGRNSASHSAISRQAKTSARKRGAPGRRRAATKAARTRQRRRLLLHYKP
jgi:transcription initiation factor TFIID subunit TAF12